MRPVATRSLFDLLFFNIVGRGSVGVLFCCIFASCDGPAICMLASGIGLMCCVMFGS